METGHSDIIMDPIHETTCLKCHHLMDVSSLAAFVEIACPECGTTQHVPAKMGAFLLIDLLGKGGMGAVYRGRDTGLDRWVAVKVMQSSFGGNPEFVETFRREAQAAAALNHPNIVQIYSFGVSHGQPYMVMELLEGGRMDQMIAGGELLNEALVLKMALDVAEGLNAAAAIGLIHGDVKPENILLDNNGIAKVVDFGLARFKESSEGGTAKGIWGTPYYIAPEKLRGHVSDARSDIYSLGGTLFHALTLQPPFDGATPMDVVKARLKGPAPRLSSLRPFVNPELEALVGRMLEADPLRRYPNYASVVADMRRILPSLKPPPAESHGQLSKKGGKIILTRKKGAAFVSAPTASSGGVEVAIPSTSSVEEDAVRPPRSFRKAKIAVGVVLGLLILAGVIGGCVASQKKRTAEEKEKALAAQYRKKASQILADLQGVSGEVSNYTVRAGGWVSNATAVVTLIMAGTEIPSDPDRTNALADLELVQRYATGTLASVTAELKGMSTLVESNRTTMLSLSNSVAVHEKLMLLTNVPARCSELVQSISEGTDRARKAVDRFDILKKKLDRDRVANQAAAERAALEKAEADKVEAERRAKEQAEAEKKAGIQAELDLIDATRKESGSLIQQHLFREAQVKIEQCVKGLKTDEGKAAGKQAVKAYQFLAELKTLIIESVKADVASNPGSGYAFGWLGAKDILGADAEKIIIRGGQVSWITLPPAQMMRFVQRYVENGDLTKREKGQYYFAVALYIYEATGRNEKHYAQAAKYLNEAVRFHSSIEDLAKSVLPGLELK
jgi:serine/threonine protein kinase